MADSTKTPQAKPTAKDASPKPKRKGRGAQLQLTPELIAKAVKLMTEGNYAETASICCGISTATWYGWKAQGQKIKDKVPGWNLLNPLYLEFLDRVDEAEAVCEAEQVRKLQTQMGDDWKCRAWYLERRNPSRWGKKSDALVNMTGQEASVSINIRPESERPKDVDLGDEE